MKHNSFYVTLLAIPMLLCLLSCKDKSPTTPLPSITISITDSSLFIANNLTSNLHLFAIEQNIAARSEYALSCDSFNILPAKSTKELKYRDISGYAQNCKIIVFWWQCNDSTRGIVNNEIIQAK